MPGGSVYKDHTFNKDTAYTYTKTAQYTTRISTVQYKCMNITKHSRKQKIQKKTQKIQKKTS
jgi:hypothetical protein